MSDLLDKWRRIDAALDSDDEQGADECLERLGITARLLDESLDTAAGEVLGQAFGGDNVTAEIGGSRYRVLRRIDSGGQSEVFLAERADGVYNRTVVIKLLAGHYHRGLMQEQFLREMQLLADLPHPGIVQILDGGLGAAERPWLVLEYIDGPHFTAYCREQQLDWRGLARLVRDLCEALQFIHLRGVVHMDIKPGNVMVRDINGTAYPVLIDFGIALQAASTADDTPGAVFGSRGYAAPEQLAGEPVDARADLYSLGMLLAQACLGDSVENVGQLPPEERMARLRRAGVPRDLRDVIGKCTREKPAARYASAAALRTDLDAWLNDLPLAVGRHRPFHVAAKALRRHTLAASIAALALAGTAWATWKYTADVGALQQATQAEKHAGDRLFNFMLGDLFDRLARIGRIDLLQLVAERSIEHLARQDPRTLDDPARLQSAVAYTNAGRVFDALEESTAALDAYQQARAILAQVEDREAHRRALLEQRSRVLILESETRASEGQREQTEAVLLEAASLAGELVERHPDASREPLWEAQLQLGWHYMEYDQGDAAGEHLRAALAIAGEMVEVEGGTRWLLDESHSWQALAWHAFDYGEPRDALTALERALVIARRARGAGDDIETLDNHRILLNQQAYMLTQLGDYAGADAAMVTAIETGERLQAMAPQNREYQRELAYSFTTGGETAERRGDDATALQRYRRGLAISREIAAADAGSFTAANDLAVDLVSVANLTAKLGGRERAEALWREAAALIEPVWRQEPDNKYYQYTLAVAWLQLGRHEEVRPLVAAIQASGMADQPFNDLLVQQGFEVK
ncbi:serine/threonine-protein kinase [Mangrovimicrobium sediminis]|uniref:Serine/threonine-protein kinase n=1 Tax=Mangrovimicrobium sediminis TaxID=2562682 RepID=A0A4Z0LZJ5_9GAMM|nr:serine/threonine-protein kinase [Haliea sp. SAOS-164]TGD72654.1 serine/threonine-protein kinase [Haliea sp. SAOS-164]